jgi:hypothetical protein
VADVPYIVLGAVVCAVPNWIHSHKHVGTGGRLIEYR